MVEKKSNQKAQDSLGAEAIDQVPPVPGEFHMRNRIMHRFAALGPRRLGWPCSTSRRLGR